MKLKKFNEIYSINIKEKITEADTFSDGGAYPGPNIVNKITGNMVGSGSDGRLGVNRTEIEGGNDAVTSIGEYPKKYKRMVTQIITPETKKRKAAIKKMKRLSMLSFDEFKEKNESYKEKDYNIINDIKEFIKTIDTWFVIYNDNDDDEILLNTKKHGNVATETYSKIDYDEAIRLYHTIKNKFSQISIKIETVDEWVHVIIYKKKKDTFKYIFIKEYGESGFEEKFDSIDELINKYHDWLDIDWDKIKENVKNIKEYPNDVFFDCFQSNKILLSKANSNEWGYNFYLIVEKCIFN